MAAPTKRFPRLFGIPATAAPVVAVIRRGPTEWSHLGRWDTDVPRYEPGTWFRGRLYPQKCDLSPDGRWFGYSAMKPGADWKAGEIYEAISRLPWLRALAAWEAGTTYTRGFHFDDDAGVNELGQPEVGDAAPAFRRYGLKLNGAVQFSVERRRGWQETAGTPPRTAGGPWDDRRDVVMEKRQPQMPDPAWLEVEGAAAAFRTGAHDHDPVAYTLRSAGDRVELNEVQWADWDAAGRLLLATTSGALQIRAVAGLSHAITWEHDLAGMAPTPEPPPARAADW